MVAPIEPEDGGRVGGHHPLHLAVLVPPGGDGEREGQGVSRGKATRRTEHGGLYVEVEDGSLAIRLGVILSTGGEILKDLRRGRGWLT